MVRTVTDPETLAREVEEANVWRQLTPVQEEAVRATAAQHLRDPVELAVELFPLLRELPVKTPLTDLAEAVTGRITEQTYSVDFTLTPASTDAAWSLLGTSEDGARVFFAPSATPLPTVNKSLTLPIEQENTP